MSAPAQPLSKAPVTRLGNTAMLVHVLGIGTGSTLAAFGYYQKSVSQEPIVFLGMGLALAVVAWFWSMLLRARALWHGESPFWPTVLTVLSGIELIGVSLLFWQLAAPVLAVGIVGSGIAATFWNRWREMREIKLGREPWDRGLRYQRKVRAFGVIFLIAAVTVLPVGLRGYVLSLQTIPNVYENPYYRLSNWVPASFDHSLFKNAVSYKRFQPNFSAVAFSGALQPQALQAFLNDPQDPLHFEFWEGYEYSLRYQDNQYKAVRNEFQIALDRLLSSGNYTTNVPLQGTYGYLMGQLLPLEVLKKHLNSEKLPPKEVLKAWVVSAYDKDEANLQSIKNELSSLASKDFYFFSFLLAAMTHLPFSEKELNAIMDPYVTSLPLTKPELYELEDLLAGHGKLHVPAGLVDERWKKLSPQDRKTALRALNGRTMGLRVIMLGLREEESPSVRRFAGEAGENHLLSGGTMVFGPQDNSSDEPLTETELKQLGRVHRALGNALEGESGNQ